MSEKPLLLSSAKSGVLVTHPSHPFRWIAFAVGVVAVAVGGADLASRAGQAAFGASAGVMAFAPLIVSLDPSALSSIIPPETHASTTPLTPTTLRVLSLGIDAEVETVGKNRDGSMGTPKQIMNVAWFGLGSRPGDTGSAVFAGHVNNGLSTAGVFEKLASIKKGAVVEVSDAQGRTLRYAVSDSKIYDKDVAPLSEIFATIGPSRLVLITCEGDWVPSEHSFDKRLVVTATLLRE